MCVQEGDRHGAITATDLAMQGQWGANVAPNLSDVLCCGKAWLSVLLLWYLLWECLFPAWHTEGMGSCFPFSFSPISWDQSMVGKSPVLTLIFSDSPAAAAGVGAGWYIMLENNNIWPSRTRTLSSNTFKDEWQSVQHVMEWMINHKMGKNNCVTPAGVSSCSESPYVMVFDDINLMTLSANADQKSIYNSVPRSFLMPLSVLGNRSVTCFSPIKCCNRMP